MRHPRDGLDVEPYQAPRQRLVHLVEVARVRVRPADVVHEHAHVESPEELPERVHLRGDVVGVEVEDEGADLRAGAPGLEVGRDGVELVGAPAHEDDPEVGRGEAERERAADAVRGARDDGPGAVPAAQWLRRAEERRVQPQREARRGARRHHEPQRCERQRPRGLRVHAGHGRHSAQQGAPRARGCAVWDAAAHCMRTGLDDGSATHCELGRRDSL